MNSKTLFKLMLLAFFIATVDARDKKSISKIIIHVPYKIHKHHHVHTKYKVISVPQLKKEPPIIIYKQSPDHQQFLKYPELTYQSVEQPKTFIPHQELQPISLGTSTNENPDLTKEIENSHPPHYQIETIKPMTSELSGHLPDASTSENQPSITVQKFFPALHKLKPPPMPTSESQFLNAAHNPNYFTKPSVSFPSTNFMSEFVFQHLVPPSQIDFLPKFTSYPLPQKNSLPHYILAPHFPFKPFPLNSYRSMISKKPFRPSQRAPPELDNIAHSSKQFYKTAISPKPYLVRETNHDLELPPLKHQHKHLNKPFSKPNHSLEENLYKTLNNEEEPEYEHVGYLIIDGNSRKIVDKNFNPEPL